MESTRRSSQFSSIFLTALGLLTSNIFLLSRVAFAAGESPQSFTYEGRVYQSDGTSPLLDTVDFKFEILNNAGNCILYQEAQLTQDLVTTKGIFALGVGSSVGNAKRTAGGSIDSLLTMAQIFQNRVAVSVPIALCAAGTFVPTAGEQRKLRVTITPQATGIPEVITLNFPVNSVPHALVAETLQGYTPLDLILQTGTVTQTNLNTLTNGGDATALHTHPGYISSGATVTLGNNSYVNGNFGIGTSAPSGDLGLGGNAARTISLDRHSTANTAGNILTVNAGGATSAATDKNGGSLVLSGGTATGTGSSTIEFKTATAQGSTNTTDNAPSTKMTILGNGNVGIGTATPTSTLSVSGPQKVGGTSNFAGFVSDPPNAYSSNLSVGSTYIFNANNADYQNGIENNSNFSPASGVVYSGTGIGFVNEVFNGDVGTTNNLIAYESRIHDNGAGGTIVSATHFNADCTNGTNCYGIVLGASGGATNSWGVYQTGAIAKNYFAGDVGIGTASPGTRLEVLTDDASNASVTNLLTLTHNTTGVANPGIGAGLLFRNENDAGSTVNTATIEAVTSDTFPGSEDGSLVFKTQNNSTHTEKMRINHLGNIGIATTDPTLGVVTPSQSRLLGITGDGTASIYSVGGINMGNNRATPASGDLTGALNFTSLNNAGGNRNTAYITGNLGGSGGANGFGGVLTLATKGDNVSGVPTARMTINYDGNVGIGTTSPDFDLEIEKTVNGDVSFVLNNPDSIGNGANTNMYWLQGGSYRAQLTSYNDGTTTPGLFSIINIQNASLALGTNNTVQMTIDASGDVGIGLTGPTARLHAYQAGGATTVIAKFQNDAATCSVTDAGMSCASDMRLKTDIEPIPNALEKVLSLDGITFRWKNGGSDQRSMGFIAQEVEKVAPELVRDDKDLGYKQVNYSNFVAVLTQAIKELYHQLTGEIDALKAENAALKQKNEAFKIYLCGKDPGAPFCKEN